MEAARRRREARIFRTCKGEDIFRRFSGGRMRNYESKVKNNEIVPLFMTLALNSIAKSDRLYSVKLFLCKVDMLCVAKGNE